ncbi:hypothetical protein SCUCBS95973_005655 [Sporothrix curviconia]|uniref:Zn(2)-C6 fungal-type domain-containing protein n=1 Tax=Sporothrix curviconia TaxID=1260050 RepID=A0ABP0BZ27_9PEZI
MTTPAITKDAFQSWQITLATTGETPHPERRARVALACQRCKLRKQKCDGVRPSCSKCKTQGATCEYILPSKYMPFGKARYVKALEKRVADLESYLTKEGRRDVGQDHWQYLPVTVPLAEGDGKQTAEKTSDRSERKQGEKRERERPVSSNGAEGTATSSDVDADGDAGPEAEDDAGAGDDDAASGVDSMITILRDLSLAANGGYMGATSHITMGRLVGSMVKGKNSMRVSSKNSSVKAHLTPPPGRSPIDEGRVRVGGGNDDEGMVNMMGTADMGMPMHFPMNIDPFASEAREARAAAFAHIPAAFADRMLAGYLTHASTAFPILHSPALRNLHARRGALENAYEVCVLHLIYAIGGRFLETTGESGHFFPEHHHTAALKLLDEILQMHDLRSVQTLMLLAIHCLRAPQGPGAWTYVGLAMRIAIDLGLHRRTAAMRRPSLDNELKKRLFWSCYNLDRQVSITLGRPFTISDRDIDVPLPLEVNEATFDVDIAAAHRRKRQEQQQQQQQRQQTQPAQSIPQQNQCTTTLSPFIHVTKLRMIESSIQQNIYRVDRGVEVSDAEINGFLEQLDAWKRDIPRRGGPGDDFGASTNEDERYMVYYYASVRLLLYPQVSRPQVPARYLTKCAEACGGVCRTYKHLHQHMTVGYSLMGLQSVFMAGLTLIYCIWVDPTLIFNSTTSNDIYACSIVLFVITERWPGARKYRDAFDIIKQIVVDAIADGKHVGPRQTVVQLKTELQSTFSTLHNLQGDEDQQDECSRILTDMAGDTIAMMEQGGLGGMGLGLGGSMMLPHHLVDDEDSTIIDGGGGDGLCDASGDPDVDGLGPPAQGGLFTDDFDMASQSLDGNESGEWLMYY